MICLHVTPALLSIWVLEALLSASGKIACNRLMLLAFQGWAALQSHLNMCSNEHAARLCGS